MSPNTRMASRTTTKCSARNARNATSLSRPINSDYATPDEWSRYIKRMMHKPGSGISNADGKKIYDFLVYDSSVRKKAMLDDKLAKPLPRKRPTPKPRSRKSTTSTIRSNPLTELECHDLSSSNCRM